MTFALQTPSGLFITGATLAEAVFGSNLLRRDHAARRLLINGVPDTVGFTDDWSGAELEREFAKRGLELLRRRGYVLFQSTDLI